jgi:hypothetical protein
MSNIQPHELSGLLDNEVEPQRVEDIRRALETDVMLGAEFARLRELDRAWAAVAAGARFRPKIALPMCGSSVRRRAIIAAGLAGLLAFRLLGKLTFFFALAMAVNLCVLIGLLAVVVWTNRRLDEEPGDPLLVGGITPGGGDVADGSNRA